MSDQPPPPPPGAAVPPPPPPPGPGATPWQDRIIPLHPLSLGELLDTSIKLYRATIPQVLIAVVLVMGPLNVLSSLANAGVDPLDPTSQPTAAGIVIAVAAVLLTALVSPLVNGAVTYLAARRDDGEDPTWQEAYREATPRFGTLLLTTILLLLISVVGIVVLAIPFVVLGIVVNEILAVVLALPVVLLAAVAVVTLFYLVVPIVMLEPVKAVEALRRSVELVRPRLLPVAGRVIVAGILLALITGIASGLFTAVSIFTGPLGFIFAAIGGTLGSLVSVPLGANVALVLYADQRMRQEGLDIQRMAEGLPRSG